jgi:hypothetical protein
MEFLTVIAKVTGCKAEDIFNPNCKRKNSGWNSIFSHPCFCLLPEGTKAGFFITASEWIFG